MGVTDITDEGAIATYAVARSLPGNNPEQLTAAVGAAKRTTAQTTQEATPVRYLRATFPPGENMGSCLFEGPSADAVRVANDRAEIPYDRVVQAMHLAAEDLR